MKAKAKGPGRVDMFDRANPKNNWPVHAKWRELLVSTKDKEGDKVLDLFRGEPSCLSQNRQRRPIDIRQDIDLKRGAG